MRFNVERDTGDRRNYICGIRGVPEQGDKKVKFQWQWPENGEYNYCFVFAVSEQEDKAGITLEALLEEQRMPEIISEAIAHPYVLTLTNTAQRVLFYPARLEADEYRILDQKKENRSEYVQKKLEISCKIHYENLGGLFSSVKLKRATIQLGFSQAEKPDCHLVYRCRGGGREGSRFGIDISRYGRSAALELVIGRDERIEFEKPAPEYERFMKLRVTG